MKARFVKLPLHSFIQQLVDLYEMGVDYVDLVGESNVIQDYLEIHFTNEYMAPGAEDPFGEGYGEEDDDESPLSDENLNQII
jgi:hypothetical protein